MATNRDERMKEITDRLQAGLEELFNSEKYAEYLRVMSQFHHYSFNNTLLIAMQKPDATLVAGYHAWEKKFNRHVMKGEKGIQIIAPAPVKEKQEQEKIDPNTGEIVMRDDGQPETEEVTIVIPRFKVSTVFDLSQTDGDPLPELGPGELTASVENYELFMNAIRSVAPVPIRFDEISSGAKGYYDNIAKEIVIQSGMSEMQTMKTAVHETAHAILHDRDIMQEQGIQKDQMTKEVEAESVAFVSLAHFELDTSDYSFPYIAGWSSGRDTKELKSSLDTIRKTSSEIIDGIEASMREQMRELQEPELIENQVVEQIAAEREAVLKEEFESVELFDVPMLFTNGHVKQEALPPGIYSYDLRGSDNDPGSPLRLETLVVVNHAGSILTRFPINLDELGYLRIGEEMNFVGGEASLPAYLESTEGLDIHAQEERIENAIGYANENLYLNGKEDRFAIYQLKDGEDLRNLRFANTDYLATHNLAVEGNNYAYIYGGRLNVEDTLDSIYERFNLHHPEGFMGHSLSVSDMVVIQRNGETRAYYVDSFGFTEIEEFVEQRTLIAAKKQRIEDAYINMNTLGVIVDGHEGMWHPLYGQEINGEMFYLMESDEYGETAGNILLHMDGDLVAEDLWSGVNYEAMEAVKEFFDQKGISYALTDFPLQERYKIEAEFTPQGEALYFIVDNVTGGPLGKNGDVQTYDNRAKLTEQLNAMNQEKKSIYRKSATYAHESNEIADYRFSMQENRACKEGIEKVIRENFDGMHLDLNVVKPVIERFGAERVAYVLANTVQLEDWDERYSHKNKEWAASFQYPDESSAFSTSRRSFLITSHPAVLDGFISRFRKELQERGLEIDGTIKNEMAVGFAEGFITVQRVDSGYDYTIFNQKCRPLDGGILENPKLNIDEAMNEILKAEGLSRGLTWDANYETIMEEAEGVEVLQTEQEPSLTYYVSSCMDCPVMGEYRETNTFTEAAVLYEEFPDSTENGGKGIGFTLDDAVPYAGMYSLVQTEKGVSKMTALEEAVSNHPLVQEAMKEAAQFVQESRETQMDRPIETQQAVEADMTEEKSEDKQAVSVDKADGAKSANRKESVLKALRELQAQIKEREKQEPEQKNRDRRKGEQAL